MQWAIGTVVVLVGLLVWRIDAGFAGVNARIDDLRGRIERLETDVRSLDDRVRGVEITLGKVDQRLATLERLPSPAR